MNNEEIQEKINYYFFKQKYNNFVQYIKSLNIFVENMAKNNFDFNQLKFYSYSKEENLLFHITRKHLSFWQRNNITKYAYQMLILLKIGSNQINNNGLFKDTDITDSKKFIIQSKADKNAKLIATFILENYKKINNFTIYENSKDLLEQIMFFSDELFPNFIDMNNYLEVKLEIFEHDSLENLKLLADTAEKQNSLKQITTKNSNLTL